MDPDRTGRRGWYKGRFSERVSPAVYSELEAAGSNPLEKSGKAPTPWTLSQLFAGAGRYSDGELVEALAAAGDVEAGLRGDMPLESLTVWLTGLLRSA
jgi:hypothetical protein